MIDDGNHAVRLAAATGVLVAAAFALVLYVVTIDRRRCVATCEREGIEDAVCEVRCRR